MFIDEAHITIHAGHGGDGAVHFRREKYLPKGGPDGGDGGDGGDIYVIASHAVHGLRVFAHQHEFEAPSGESGRGKKQTGVGGVDLELVVPVGTVIWNEEKPGEILADLKEPHLRIRLAEGGKGGRGNVHFASAINQTPRFAERGTLGQTKQLRLEVKLIADAGLIGQPNAGKSSFLAAVSEANPKIADYPFTTLEPQLGVVNPTKVSPDRKPLDFNRPLVVADIPGLIEGASRGKGLGHGFLRHIERTRVLVHFIAATEPHPNLAHTTIRTELYAWSPTLAAKPEIVVISKVDLVDDRRQRQLFHEVRHLNPIFLSTVTGRGIRDVLTRIHDLILAEDKFST